MKGADDNRLGAALRRSRIGAGLSVKALARAAADAGYTSTTPFYDAERGSRIPSPKLIAAYERHCGQLERPQDPLDVGASPDALLMKLFSKQHDLEALERGVRSRVEGFAMSVDPERHHRLSSASECLDAALWLLLSKSPPDKLDQVFLVQRNPVNRLTDFPDDSHMRRYLAAGIRLALADGRRVTHVTNSGIVGSLEPQELLRRYLDLQRLPGDYELYRSEHGTDPGAADTLVRPGVGVLHLISTDAVNLKPHVGDLFPVGAAGDYIDRRAVQAQHVAHDQDQPFSVHDHSSTYGAGFRRARVEQALVNIEQLRGPRVVVKDGLPDLLAPAELLDNMLDGFAPPTSTSDDGWRTDWHEAHQKRLHFFRKQISDFDFTDVIPLASLEALRQAPPHNRTRGVAEHLDGVASTLESYPRYRLLLLDGPLADAIAGSGEALMAKSDEGSGLWRLYFELDHTTGDDVAGGSGRITVALETSAEYYRAAIGSSMFKFASSHFAKYDRKFAVTYLRQLASSLA